MTPSQRWIFSLVKKVAHLWLYTFLSFLLMARPAQAQPLATFPELLELILKLLKDEDFAEYLIELSEPFSHFFEEGETYEVFMLPADSQEQHIPQIAISYEPSARPAVDFTPAVTPNAASCSSSQNPFHFGPKKTAGIRIFPPGVGEIIKIPNACLCHVYPVIEEDYAPIDEECPSIDEDDSDDEQSPSDTYHKIQYKLSAPPSVASQHCPTPQSVSVPQKEGSDQMLFLRILQQEHIQERFNDYNAWRRRFPEAYFLFHGYSEPEPDDESETESDDESETEVTLPGNFNDQLVLRVKPGHLNANKLFLSLSRVMKNGIHIEFIIHLGTNELPELLPMLNQALLSPRVIHLLSSGGQEVIHQILEDFEHHYNAGDPYRNPLMSDYCGSGISSQVSSHVDLSCLVLKRVHKSCATRAEATDAVQSLLANNFLASLVNVQSSPIAFTYVYNRYRGDFRVYGIQARELGSNLSDTILDNPHIPMAQKRLIIQAALESLASCEVFNRSQAPRGERTVQGLQIAIDPNPSNIAIHNGHFKIIDMQPSFWSVDSIMAPGNKLILELFGNFTKNLEMLCNSSLHRYLFFLAMIKLRLKNFEKRVNVAREQGVRDMELENYYHNWQAIYQEALNAVYQDENFISAFESLILPPEMAKVIIPEAVYERDQPSASWFNFDSVLSLELLSQAPRQRKVIAQFFLDQIKENNNAEAHPFTFFLHQGDTYMVPNILPMNAQKRVKTLPEVARFLVDDLAEAVAQFILSIKAERQGRKDSAAAPLLQPYPDHHFSDRASVSRVALSDVELTNLIRVQLKLQYLPCNNQNYWSALSLLLTHYFPDKQVWSEAELEQAVELIKEKLHHAQLSSGQTTSINQSHDLDNTPLLIQALLNQPSPLEVSVLVIHWNKLMRPSGTLYQRSPGSRGAAISGVEVTSISNDLGSLTELARRSNVLTLVCLDHGSYDHRTCSRWGAASISHLKRTHKVSISSNEDAPPRAKRKRTDSSSSSDCIQDTYCQPLSMLHPISPSETHLYPSTDELSQLSQYQLEIYNIILTVINKLRFFRLPARNFFEVKTPLEEFKDALPRSLRSLSIPYSHGDMKTVLPYFVALLDWIEQGLSIPGPNAKEPLSILIIQPTIGSTPSNPRYSYWLIRRTRQGAVSTLHHFFYDVDLEMISQLIHQGNTVALFTNTFSLPSGHYTEPEGGMQTSGWWVIGNPTVTVTTASSSGVQEQTSTPEKPSPDKNRKQPTLRLRVVTPPSAPPATPGIWPMPIQPQVPQNNFWLTEAGALFNQQNPPPGGNGQQFQPVPNKNFSPIQTSYSSIRTEAAPTLPEVIKLQPTTWQEIPKTLVQSSLWLAPVSAMFIFEKGKLGLMY